MFFFVCFSLYPVSNVVKHCLFGEQIQYCYSSLSNSVVHYAHFLHARPGSMLLYENEIWFYGKIVISLNTKYANTVHISFINLFIYVL